MKDWINEWICTDISPTCFFFFLFTCQISFSFILLTYQSRGGRTTNKTALCSRLTYPVSQAQLQLIIVSASRTWICQQLSVRLCQVWQITETSSSQAWAWESSCTKHFKNLPRQRAALAKGQESPFSGALVCSGSLQVPWDPWFTVPGTKEPGFSLSHLGSLSSGQLTLTSACALATARTPDLHEGPLQRHIKNRLHLALGSDPRLAVCPRLRFPAASRAGTDTNALCICLPQNLDSVLFYHWFPSALEMKLILFHEI